MLSRKFFINSDLEIVYGDTDSCMITGKGSREQISKKVEDVLMLLHSHMEITSIYMMRMKIEECYQKGIMIDKKRYCMLLLDGSTKKVGISLSRKDVSGLRPYSIAIDIVSQIASLISCAPYLRWRYRALSLSLMYPVM